MALLVTIPPCSTGLLQTLDAAKSCQTSRTEGVNSLADERQMRMRSTEPSRSLFLYDILFLQYLGLTYTPCFTDLYLRDWSIPTLIVPDNHRHRLSHLTSGLSTLLQVNDIM